MNKPIIIWLLCLLAFNPDYLSSKNNNSTDYSSKFTCYLSILNPVPNVLIKPNNIQYSQRIKSDSGMDNKLHLSTDLSGLFRTDIYKDFNPDARKTKAQFSLIPLYKFNKFSIGFGTFITLENYQNKFLLAYWERSIISFGPAINYTLRDTKKVPILIYTRFLHNIYNEQSSFNSIPQEIKLNYRSVVVGTGPTIRLNKTNISPTFSITTNFNDAYNRKRIFAQSSIIINITRNIY